MFFRISLRYHCCNNDCDLPSPARKMIKLLFCDLSSADCYSVTRCIISFSCGANKSNKIYIYYILRKNKSHSLKSISSQMTDTFNSPLIPNIFHFTLFTCSSKSIDEWHYWWYFNQDKIDSNIKLIEKLVTKIKIVRKFSGLLYNVLKRSMKLCTLWRACDYVCVRRHDDRVDVIPIRFWKKNAPCTAIFLGLVTDADRLYVPRRISFRII